MFNQAVTKIVPIYVQIASLGITPIGLTIGNYSTIVLLRVNRHFRKDVTGLFSFNLGDWFLLVCM